MRAARNCSNVLGLSEEARIVESFTENIAGEIARIGAVKVFSLGSIRFYECPLTALSAQTFEMIRIVYLIESSGRLYFDGGWAGQPHWLVEAYEIYKRERYQYLKGQENVER
jgi:hypothetical protein